MKMGPGTQNLKNSKFSEKKDYFFTFSIFEVLGAQGPVLGQTGRFFGENPFWTKCTKKKCISFFSVLEQPKSVFLSFPVKYSISAFFAVPVKIGRVV